MSVPNDEVFSVEQEEWRKAAREMRRRVNELVMAELSNEQLYALAQTADLIRRFDLYVHAFDTQRDNMNRESCK